MKNKIFYSTVLLFATTFLFGQKSEKKNPNFHTFLGVDVDNNSIKTNGLFVNGVYKGFGAEKAGLKRGDSVMAIYSHPIYNFDELVRTLDKYNPGETVEVSIIRNNLPQKISVTVSEYPDFLKYNSMAWVKEMNTNETSGQIKRAKLGVDAEPVWDRYAVKVSEVSENSGAATAGIQTGDIILKMDNYEFATMEELKYYLSKYKPGDVATLSVLHDGQLKSVKVTLGEEVIYWENKKEKEKNKNKEKKYKVS